MHFIFDCDDVLLDWKGAFYTWVRSAGFSPDPTGPHEWDLSKWLGTTNAYTRRLIMDFNNSNAFRSLAAIPNAKETVWRLNDAGHTVAVLSSCGDTSAVRQGRQHNLMMEFALPIMGGHHFAFTTVAMLPLGAAKFDYLYRASLMPRETVVVEDSFQHAQSGAVNGIRSYCIRKAHNRADESANPTTSVIWIDDIGEV